MLDNTEIQLMKKQKGICAYCKGSFKESDLWETDYMIPLSEGGKREMENLQLIHKHCYLNKTRNKLKEATESRVNNHTVSQERCEVKVSRTVLKTSGNREIIP